MRRLLHCGFLIVAFSFLIHQPIDAARKCPGNCHFCSSGALCTLDFGDTCSSGHCALRCSVCVPGSQPTCEDDACMGLSECNCVV